MPLWLPAVAGLIAINVVLLVGLFVAPAFGRRALWRGRRRRHLRSASVSAAIAGTAFGRSGAREDNPSRVLLEAMEARDLAALVKAMRHSSPTMRFAAAQRAGLLASAEDAPLLCRALMEIDRPTRRVLLASLSLRDLPAGHEVRATASRPGPARVAALRLLGSTSGHQARRVLASALRDPEAATRRVAAAALAASARTGFPRPLEPDIVDAVLRVFEAGPAEPAWPDALDALTYSLDARVPGALLQQIPSSAAPERDRLVEAGAIATRIATSAGGRRRPEGA